MKNNLPSPRFLCEFDTVDTLALRNISEKRKLQRHLGHLDKQLHSNLVRMESEILSIRLENCESSPDASPTPQRRKPKAMKGKGNVNKGKGKISVHNSRAKMETKSVNPARVMPKDDHIDASDDGTQKFPSSLDGALPKITTSSYFTAKQEQLEKETEFVLNKKSASLETISELGQKQLHAEQRILMSLQRPRSNLNTKNSGSESRPPTPQASNLLPSPFKPMDRQRRASSYGLLAPLPDDASKGRLYRAFSAPDVTESLNVSDLGRLRGLPRRQHQSFPGHGNGTAETHANGIRIYVSGENDSPNKAKPERKKTLKSNASKVVVAESNRTKDFDDVVRRRLQLLDDGVPEREDLERIRYLRLKDENSNADEVEDVFAVLHQNKHE